MSGNGTQNGAGKFAVPMQGIRVLNLGVGWPGRVAAMLLADQGAEVIEIVKPGREANQADPLMDRGKRLVELDLKDDGARAQCQALAADADIVIENMRPGVAAKLGLDHQTLDGLAAARGSLVYVSLPGFAEGDPNRDIPAWDGVVNAATGVFTDISPLGRLLGGDPVFTAIPMASAYGGILGALTASLGLYHRQATGTGQRLEVPLADAVMSAMALLIADIEGQPWRYNFPMVDHVMMDTVFPIFRDLREHMTDDHVAMVAEYLKSIGHPALNFYEASDGRILFVCGFDHVYQTRMFMQVTGVYDRAIAEGMVCDTPFSESEDGNNINKAAALKPEFRKRLIDMIGESVKRKPAREWEELLRDANVPATVVQTTAEWLADTTLHQAGVTADVEDATLGSVRQAGRFISLENDRMRSPALTAATNGAAAPAWSTPAVDRPAPSVSATGAGMLDGIKVLDFSNIIAGPAAGRTLAEHGADVVRVDSPAPLAGPYATMWFGVDVNQGKRAIILDLKSADGKAALAKLVKQSDVVLHNFLDKSADALGIDHDTLAAINPDIISCQVGAWTGAEGGEWSGDPAFDPVLQAATGIMARYGTLEQPTLHAIASCVDYMTGFLATLGITQALVARQQGQGGSFVSTSLAMGAQLVQFPFMVSHAGWQPGDEPSGQLARGDGPEQSLYPTADGWAFIGCRPGDGAKLADALGASDPSWDGIAMATKRIRFTDLQGKLAELPGAGAMPSTTLESIREDRTTDDDATASNWLNSGSFLLKRGPHPSGYRTTIPLPTWIRPEKSAVKHLHPAPAPGENTEEVLAEAGHSPDEVGALVASGAARTNWAVLNNYLPR